MFPISSAGYSDYCSPGCGKTVKGEICSDECETRKNKYYWCNVGKTWDYCSRTSCPIRVPPLYKDCSAEMVNKTVSFENLYYPEHWLAKGHSNELAALWKPKGGINGKDLYSPNEGYGWCMHGGEDGSVYLETTRPGYQNYFLIGYVLGHNSNGNKKNKVYNMAEAVHIEYNKQYHETFAFRILCEDCSTKQNCIMWRFRDEYKLYSAKSGYLKMCRACGSDNWFNWRVLVHNNTNLRCQKSSNGNGLFSSDLFRKHLSITFVIILFAQYSTALSFEQVF